MAEKVLFIYDHELRCQSDKLPTMLKRASIVYDLIYSYGLLFNNKIQAANSTQATEDELKTFHTDSYIDFLKKINNVEKTDLYEEESIKYGLSYDCPLVENSYDFVKIIAGGSLTAAKFLLLGKHNVAINWLGGWHHARRSRADGFCYINDIVIAIHKLQEKFDRILYVDLDVHHGDGVQNAFESTNTVLTLSFHKYAPGFYPGTGSLEDVGKLAGKYYSFNVPFLHGLGNESYLYVFKKILSEVTNAYEPNALVVQCGADILNDDPIGQCNVTLETMGECIREILKLENPTLFLGGGGYNFPNAARYWTYLTSIIVNTELDEDIPDDSNYFTLYVPTYELKITSGNMRDQNTKEYLDRVCTQIAKYCEYIKCDVGV